MKTNVCRILFVVCAFSILLCSCAPFYNEEWIIGKTADEIIDRYGQFDTRYNNSSLDGTYKGWIGTYTIREERVGYLQTYPKEVLKIMFDADNIATECKVILDRPGN